MAHPLPNPTFWRGRRVLVTGHNGFKGRWLSEWLGQLGAELFGVALPRADDEERRGGARTSFAGTEILADIASADWQDGVQVFNPEVTIHLAAQALVPASYVDPVSTFATNVLGTARVLDVLGRTGTSLAAVMVTTDKVYDIRQPVPYAEDAYLGGVDPYSASKAAMELLIQSWPHSQTGLGRARAGNVIGGGDWSANRLVPDFVRARADGRPMELRSPDSTRPWQHVLEPLRGYLLYAEALASGAAPSALNFGPLPDQCVSVKTVMDLAETMWPADAASTNSWLHSPQGAMHETRLLELDSTLAHKTLDWSAVWDWRASLTTTLDWYRDYLAGEAERELILRDIQRYQNDLQRA